MVVPVLRLGLGLRAAPVVRQCTQICQVRVAIAVSLGRDAALHQAARSPLLCALYTLQVVTCPFK